MKIINLFLPIFLVFSLLFGSVEKAIQTSEAINNKVLRFHIVANSDSTQDQDIKLKLRDYVLNETSNIFTGKTVEENIKIAENNLKEITALCNKFLYKNNCKYNAIVCIDKEYFSTRVYDDFTLPAGVYNALKITLGEGNGHNWWCIIFPSVCLSSCSSSMKDYLTDEEYELITDSYTPKLKIIEIYEKLKYRLENQKEVGYKIK